MLGINGVMEIMDEEDWEGIILIQGMPDRNNNKGYCLILPSGLYLKNINTNHIQLKVIDHVYMFMSKKFFSEVCFWPPCPNWSSLQQIHFHRVSFSALYYPMVFHITLGFPIHGSGFAAYCSVVI